MDTTERGDMGRKHAQIEGENRMTLVVTLLVKILVLCVMMNTYFWNKLLFFCIYCFAWRLELFYFFNYLTHVLTMYQALISIC